jgi:hypothetical protein
MVKDPPKKVMEPSQITPVWEIHYCRSYHFGWKTLSRDPDMKFIWERSLHVAEVHTRLQSCGNESR